ncbi:MAG: amidohydrolase family protein [Bacteroidia bacterium]
MRKLILFILILFPVFGNAQNRSFLIENVVIHKSDKTIENGVIGVQGDSIVLCADARVIKYDKRNFDTIISGAGNHIWPAFISLNTVIGLTEIDAVRATIDFDEVGIINPHVRSLTSFNTDSRILPTLVNSGVLMVQSCPQGGLISGSSSVFNVSGWNWEDAVVKADDGIHLNWPSLRSRKNSADTSDANKNAIINRRKLQEFFDLSAAYCRIQNPEKINLLYEGMRPVWNGTANLYLHASLERDIRDAVLFAKSNGVKRIVLVGAEESSSQLKLLKENNIPVILARLHRLPDKPDESPVENATLPALLENAGILTALCYEGDMEAMGSRNLPFTAGNAVSYGLNPISAMNMISKNAAQIIGIDNYYGSLEAGKKASFFMCNGNALDMRSAGALRVWINGIEISTDSHQKQLYRKYLQHFELKEN